jgi:hypothetical protein
MKDMTECQYKYEYFRFGKCLHEAIDGKDVCYWHEDRTNKHPIEELKTRDFKNLDLVEVNLQGADLRDANLQGAKLWGANLQGADLRDANFQGANLIDANFQGAELWGTDLQGADLRDANFQGAELWGTDLQEARLHKVNFDNSNLWEAKLDETVMNEIHGDKEKETKKKLEDFEEASQIYRNLKNYFRNEGIYERSGHYYYREKVVEKKIYKQENKGKYLGSLLLDLLCGYGEKPGRIIYSALTVIIISAILYYGVGIEAYVIEEHSFQVVKISYSSQFTIHENLGNLVTCSYFSVVTFTTLGYGDFHPVGISRTIAMVEAFTGVFMLALFVLTMGRKMMR